MPHITKVDCSAAAPPKPMPPPAMIELIIKGHVPFSSITGVADQAGFQRELRRHYRTIFLKIIAGMIARDILATSKESLNVTPDV